MESILMASNLGDRKSKTKPKWLSGLLVVGLLSLGGALGLSVLTDLRLNGLLAKDKYATGNVNAGLVESLELYQKFRPFRMGEFLDKTFFAQTEDSVMSSLHTSVNGEYQEVGNFVDSSVTSVALSPDGQTIAAGSFDSRVRLWSRNGKLLNTLKGHEGNVTSVVFSPDGQTIASGSGDCTVKLWSRDGKLLNTLIGHGSPVNRVAYNRDGQIISRSRNTTICGVNSVAFSPDGQTIASGSHDKTVKLWSRDGKLLNTFKRHDEYVSSVMFSPDGQTIASGSRDKTVKLWSRDGKLLNTLKGHDSEVSSVVFSPDGQTIASGSWDKTIKLWSRDGKLLNTLKGHDSYVDSMVFSPDGQTIASGSVDKTTLLT